jgi:hypothetical protein
MKQSVRIAAAIAAASLSIGLVAGCGGSDSSASSSAADTTAAAADTTAVDTTAVGTDVGMAINAACMQFETDGLAAATAGDATAFATAFDTYKASVADAVSGAAGDANAAAYLAAVESAQAGVDAVKADVDAGATFEEALDKVDTTADDEALAAAAKAGGYDTCLKLHLGES